MYCRTRKRCTATRTATPANFSEKQQHAMDRLGPFQAQEGHRRTPADKACRVPPSAVPSIYYEPLYTSSKAKGYLRCFMLYLCTATAFQPLSQRSKVDAEMQNRNRENAPKGPILFAADERNTRSLHVSQFLVVLATWDTHSKIAHCSFHPMYAYP